MLSTRWLCLFLLLLSPYSARAGHQESKHLETILVVESYHAEYLWDKSYKRGLEEVLGQKYNLVYFEMDTKRRPESEYAARAELAWQQYLAISPTLVILADDNALKYLGPKFLKTTTPVVFLGINANPRMYGVAGAPNFSGVNERPLLKRSLFMLNKFIPVKRALILFDTKQTSQVIQRELFYGRDSTTISGIHADIKLVASFSEWQEHVLTAKTKGYDVLITGLYHALVDDSGQHVSDNTVIEWTSANSKIPPFGFWDFSIGKNKSIGGYVIFGYQEGKKAAEVALELLANNKKHLRFETGGRGQFLFSKTQMEKWHIVLPEEIEKQALFVD